MNAVDKKYIDLLKKHNMNLDIIHVMNPNLPVQEILEEKNKMVIAGSVEENVPSFKMLEKLGFTYEGRKHKAFYHPIQGAIDLLYFYIERG